MDDSKKTKAHFIRELETSKKRTADIDKSLRKRAEIILAQDPQAIRRMAATDIQKLIHELNVHQIELEIQNDELRRVQIELQETRDKYLDLYDFAPSAYFTLDRNGLIVDMNLTGGELLGSKKPRLIGTKFTASISPDSQDAFYLRYREVLKTSIKCSWEIKMAKANGTTFHAQLICMSVPQKDRKISHIRVAVIDITERKQAAEALRESNEKTQKTLDAVILAMASTSEIRDPYTAGHQLKVAHLAKAIAEEMQLATLRVASIYTTGLVHDIGKIIISPEILNKSRRLNDLEYSLVKLHPQAGYDILNNIDFSFPLATWVLQHHERLNGSGYPAGLIGDKISIESKIMAVADVVEAMVSYRPYRPALDISEALGEITRNKGVLYDAEVVDACIKLITEKGFEVIE